MPAPEPQDDCCMVLPVDQSPYLFLPVVPVCSSASLLARQTRLLYHWYIPVFCRASSSSSSPIMSGRGAPRQSGYPMISVDEALHTILQHTTPLPPKKVPLSRALGCVLAETVLSPAPQPAFPASIMDGYAVVASDGPGTYPVVGRVRAGIDPEAQGLRVTPGTVAYITTGAKLPPGADAVVKVEDTEEGEVDGATGQEASVKVMVSSSPGKWVRAVGSDVAQGQVVLQQGTQVGAAEVGLLASLGVAEVAVVPKPRVGVLSTGDEIDDHATSQGAASGGARIRDSNRPALLALYASLLLQGGEDEWGPVVDLGIVRDEEGEQAFSKRITDAFDKHGCDVVVTSGGVSMGEADLLKPVLAALGTIHFGRLNMKPGKPTTFATITTDDSSSSKKQQQLVFALPGNPVSCLVTSHLLVSPALRRLQGRLPHECMLPQVCVRLSSEVALDPERPEYQRVSVQYDNHDKCFLASSTGGQISSRLLSMAAANALICIPAGQGRLSRGTEVAALLIGPLPAPAPDQCYHRKAATAMMPSPNPQQQHQDHKQQEVEYEGCPCCKPTTAPPPPPPPPPPQGTSSATTTATTTTTTGGEAAAVAVVRVGLVTVSDRAHSGTYQDKSGPAMAAVLAGMSGLSVSVVGTSVVPDDVKAIQDAVTHWTDQAKVDAVFTSGGTGFAPRDLTPEAIRPLLDKEAPGLVFRIMQVGTQHTPLAVISRPVAGVRGSALVVTLPGSPKAVKENLEALQPLLPKVFSLIKTATCDHKDMAVVAANK